MKDKPLAIRHFEIFGTDSQEWLCKINQPSVWRRADFYYEQLDALVVLRKHARQELLAEGKRHQAWKLLRSIPTLGPIRVAVLMAIVQTPHRFRANRMFWKYSGFGVVTQTSADHRLCGRAAPSIEETGVRTWTRARSQSST